MTVTPFWAWGSPGVFVRTLVAASGYNFALSREKVNGGETSKPQERFAQSAFS